MTDAPAQNPLADQTPGYTCQVFAAADLYVSNGVNHGDGLTGLDDVCLGDTYMLDPDSAPLRLTLAPPTDAGFRAQTIGDGRGADQSQVGQPGDPITPGARFTLMAPDGDTVEVLLLEHRSRGRGTDVALYALPLSPIGPQIEYTLLKADADPNEARLADLVCVSFTRGTMITLASGEQRPIEALTPGDPILTRDHGPQPIRWIARATLRGVGAFAPVVITKGTLGNAGDLIVSQHHRMFLYQRDRRAGMKTAELLVQAKHLVDGNRVFRREGGFVDYFSLIFDRHEIIYAEGIPAESLMVNDATLSRLPEDLADEVKSRFPGLSQNQHFGTEAGRQTLDEIGREGLYRSARVGVGR